ncbi:MAG: flagellar hook-basal body complex protein FliE [Solirubrobacteraceae bacterium]|nr:flagellar hook-basal body complex protein FliE [Solirubrobacteraceae bacterium]
MIDPTMAIRGGEWAVSFGEGIPAGPAATGSGGGAGFGGVLSDQIGALEKLQTDAAQGSQALAAGTATDPAEDVMAVEKARLGMQLASQIRTKSVDAIQDIFHTQV